ncbi:MAG: PAS domain-containing protein [Syntrophobacteraceae bacterium]|nr:PAS domain-containing protein [Syntrophobacteraceae bacterium]
MRDEEKSREQLLADLHSLRHRVEELEEERAHLKQEQEELKESEPLHRLALEAANIGAWDWDLVSDKHTWSRVQEAIWGYAPGTFPGTTRAFKKGVHPDDLPRLLEAEEDSKKNGDLFRSEFRVIRPDGRMRWVASTGLFLFDAHRQPVRVTGVLFDITERQRTCVKAKNSAGPYSRQLR